VQLENEQASDEDGGCSQFFYSFNIIIIVRKSIRFIFFRIIFYFGTLIQSNYKVLKNKENILFLPLEFEFSMV
jgi:hypothetical protein